MHIKDMNIDSSEHPYAAFLSVVLYICNLSLSTFLINVDLGHVTQVMELVKVVSGIFFTFIGTLFMYIIHSNKINEFVRAIFKKQ